MIAPGETIVLDAGTTMIEIARQLPADSDLTVVTCAWNVASQASSRPRRASDPVRRFVQP